MAFTGSIRGAIAFGLSMEIQTSYTHYAVLTHSALVLIFITTILFGALMPFVINYYRAKDLTDAIAAIPNIYEYELLERDKSLIQEVKFVSAGTYDYDFSHPNNKLLEYY
jgi:hypothetical protein